MQSEPEPDTDELHFNVNISLKTQMPKPEQKKIYQGRISKAAHQKFKVSAPIETFCLYMQILPCEPTFSTV